MNCLDVFTAISIFTFYFSFGDYNLKPVLRVVHFSGILTYRCRFTFFYENEYSKYYLNSGIHSFLPSLTFPYVLLSCIEI